MGTFERYLTLWVAISIVLGVTLGILMPDFFVLLAKLEIAHVNIIIAVLIWLMIYPMMLQIDFLSIKDIRKQPKGFILTLSVNWLVKPFTMAFLAWIFFKVFYRNIFDDAQANDYIAGMILLGIAPCTAMVFVWSQLTKGNANYTLVQVALNDLVMIVAFAPLAALLLGISNITVPWQTLILSVLLYVVLPLLAALVTQTFFNKKGKLIEPLISKIKPYSILGLIATVILLFALQAQKIVDQPIIIALIAIPLILQSYGIFFITYFLARKAKLSYDIAAPACLIGTSNFFELAVAVAISLFGLHSGAALATVVGVLVEVPVMLSLVKFANHYRHHFD